MKFLLNSGRTISQGAGIDRKNRSEYRDEASICRINPLDMVELEIITGNRIKAANEHGEVVLTAVENSELPKGTVFVPMGPYANQLVSSNTQSTGMPDFKSTEIEIEPSDERVKEVFELMVGCGGVRYEG